jgi:hypothetical protein
MRRFLLLATGVVAPSLFVCPAAHAFADLDNSGTAAAAKAVGCSIDPKLRFATALDPWPGAKGSAMRIVATLSNPREGGEVEEDLGELCVGVVQSVDSAFAKVATLSAPGPRAPAEITPIYTAFVTVDGAPYKYAPSQTAFAVRVTGELNTTAVIERRTTLYLFRVNGDHIDLIFKAKVGDETIDKTGDEIAGDEVICEASLCDRETRSIKFSPRMTRGAFDLLLSDKSHRNFKRYVWSGARYSAE